MLTKRIAEVLKDREFISVSTCNLKGEPNAAPKFFLKLERNFIYLIDYTIGRTWGNLKENPRISLSLMDTETLSGYQINGMVEIIESGLEFENIYAQLLQKQINLSAKRIIEGIGKAKRHSSFEVAMADKFVILKVAINEIAEIVPGGEVKRERV